jgi:transposase
MSKAQLVITAVVLEGRSKTEVARDYDLSRQWVHQLVTRYKADGSAAFQPRSRRPHTNPRASSTELEERIVRLRKTLDKAGYDAGAATIAEHLARDPDATKAPALYTIWRILTRRGFVVPNPTNAPAQPGNASPPPNPTSSGKPTSPTGSPPTAPRSKSSTSSTTLAGGAGQPGPTHHDRPRRRGHLPRRVRPLGHPRRSLHRHSNLGQRRWACPVGRRKDRCRLAPARHRCLTDWSAQRLLAC